MPVIETERLVLRHAEARDAAFILELVNEPSWLRFIGDRGVRTLEDATRYIASALIASYERHGFGLYLVEDRGDGAPIGLCGLVKRESLPDVDVGFALLPDRWGRGLAFEAAAATLEHARALGLRRVVAVTAPDNERALRLLERLGMSREGTVRLKEGGEESLLFGRDLG